MTIARSVVILLLGVGMFLVAHFLPKGESDLLLWYKLEPADIAKVTVLRPNRSFSLINKSPENYSFDNWSYQRDSVIDDKVSRSFESFLTRLVSLKIGEKIADSAVDDYEITDDAKLLVNYEIDSSVEVRFGGLSPYFKTLRYAEVSRNGEPLGIYLIDDSFYQMVVGKENTFREKYRLRTDVTEVEIIRGEERLSLVKDSLWQAPDYIDYPISQEYIAEYLRVIRSISVGEFLDSAPADIGEAKLTIKLGEKSINFYGKENLIFSVDGRFYKSESNILGRLVVPFSNFLRKTIVDPLETDDVESFTVTIAEDNYKLYRKDDTWEFDQEVDGEAGSVGAGGELPLREIEESVSSATSIPVADAKFIEQYLQDLPSAECDHSIDDFQVMSREHFRVEIKLKEQKDKIELTGDLGKDGLVRARLGPLRCVMTPSGKIQLFPHKEKFILLNEREKKQEEAVTNKL